MLLIIKISNLALHRNLNLENSFHNNSSSSSKRNNSSNLNNNHSNSSNNLVIKINNNKFLKIFLGRNFRNYHHRPRNKCLRQCLKDNNNNNCNKISSKIT